MRGGSLEDEGSLGLYVQTVSLGEAINFCLFPKREK